MHCIKAACWPSPWKLKQPHPGCHCTAEAKLCARRACRLSSSERPQAPTGPAAPMLRCPLASFGAISTHLECQEMDGCSQMPAIASSQTRYNQHTWLLGAHDMLSNQVRTPEIERAAVTFSNNATKPKSSP